MPCPFWPGGTFGFGGGLGSLFNTVFTLILLIGLGLLVWWIVRQVIGGSSGESSSRRALEILNERYAKGEITKEEYEERKRALMG